MYNTQVFFLRFDKFIQKGAKSITKDMILKPPFYEKCNHYHSLCRNENKLKVGDWVYYIPETNKYSIRKSRIKEMHIIPARRPDPLFDHCELLLENGATVDYNDTFNSKEDVLEYIITSLKQSIVCDKQQMITLQKEIETKERLLNLFEGKRKIKHKIL